MSMELELHAVFVFKVTDKLDNIQWESAVNWFDEIQPQLLGYQCCRLSHISPQQIIGMYNTTPPTAACIASIILMKRPIP